MQTRQYAGKPIIPSNPGEFYDAAFFLDARGIWPLEGVRAMQFYIEQLFKSFEMGNDRNVIEQEMIKQENKWYELQQKAAKLNSEIYAQADMQNKTPLQKPSLAIEDKLGHFLLEAADIGSDVNGLVIDQSNLASVVLKKAALTHDKMEKRYGNYSKLSYLLYTVGWGLGLFGKLLGIGSSEAG